MRSITPRTENERLHAGGVVKLGKFLARRCPCCEVTRTLEEFPRDNPHKCNYCEALGR